MRKGVLIIFGICLILTTCYASVIYYKSTVCQTKRGKQNNNKTTKEIGSLKDGDIIFQTSQSQQSKAIQLATHSSYSHCGIVFWQGNKCFVFEAVQPVKSTPIEQWISRGMGGKYVVKRLQNADEVLTPANLQKLKSEGEKLKGKSYDTTFEWDDNKIYCSELIWKVYQRATGIELGKLQQLQDFDLSHTAVKSKMKERYGDAIPFDEKVISPQALFDSEQLTTLIDTY